jgi:hypothetical protein
MPKCVLLIFCVCIFSEKTNAQKNKTDSLERFPANTGETLHEILADVTEGKEQGSQYIAPLLTATRDPFYAAAAFQFSAFRFRIRGYDGGCFQTAVNGLPMNALDDGNTPWSLWSGLNDVFRNSVMTIGLRNNEYGFGGIGNSASIDIRAWGQRKQTLFSYGLSNRSHAHRLMITHHSGRQKKGWAFSFSGSRRWAEENHTSGGFYDGWSYCLVADKDFRDKHRFSLAFFGAPLRYGKQGAVLMESVELAGTTKYNPYWGHQSGTKRNANTSHLHQPVLLLTHEYKGDPRIHWLSSIVWISGYKNSTGLDWYKAADPRPDYYRYLPSFQQDSLLGAKVAEEIRSQKALQQINWQKIYAINRESFETINDVDGVAGRTVSGLRSRYIIEERVNHQQRLYLSSTVAIDPAEDISLRGGIQIQQQNNHYYKQLIDLLGGAFYVNWNQFAERDQPNNSNAVQHDLDRPNRIIRKGDAFGYNYTLQYRYATAWLQAAVTKNRLDGFVTASLSYTSYCREGHVRNGLFPGNSRGTSDLVGFNTYALKAGVTYKLDGRRYLFLHTAMLTRAPLASDIYISPRTRDTRQDVSAVEKIQTVEAGYVWNTPGTRLRLTGYATRSDNGLNMVSFYHDEYKSFVNYAISNISKVHAGLELGIEAPLNNRWSMTGAAAIGRYYYTSRQQVAISLDNDDHIVAKEEIYTRNFRIPGTPQEAYHMGLRYQSPSFFFFHLSASYLRQQWLDFNPVRRTYQALEGVVQNSDQWNRIIDQLQLPPAHTINAFAGKSWLLRTARKGIFRTLMTHISASNLLNQRSISGGYEQLRFDLAEKNTNKFPPKFFFLPGISFSLGCSLRF